MKVVLASRNQKKIRELETLLAENTSIKAEVLSLDDIGYTEDIIENGASFRENALIKASVPASLGYIGIADDSGLMVDALHGEPGIYSARYAGEGATDQDNNQKLLTALAGVPLSARGAGFVSVVACVLPAGLSVDIPAEMRVNTKDGLVGFTVRGECRGTILYEAHGDGGFGYDPLFFVQESEKTFAQLSAAEKNSISHRGHAMRAFCAAFGAIFEKH